MSDSYDVTRRFILKGIMAACLLSVSRVGFAALTQMVAVRVWPSSTYTRITLESNIPLTYHQFFLTSPARLVIDIDNLEVNSTLRNITTLVQKNDPYIKELRVGQYKKDVARLVIELKQGINPNIFKLKPISEFKHRLVIDLYPQKKAKVDEDPLLGLLENFNKGKLTNTENDTRPTNKNNAVVIVIDPGHGGEDPGAIGYNKTKEKDVVLQIARRLRNLIKKEANMNVYMTRDEDVFLPLNVRVAKARSLHADLFISIHADAFKRREAKGSSVFVLSTRGASSSAASYLAQTQNEADEIGGVSRSGDHYLDHTILDLVQKTTISNSVLLGESILNQIKHVNPLHKKNIEHAAFSVLKAPDVPSVLVETAFISNPEEEKRLRTSHFQNQLATAMLKGIKNYIHRRKV
ncbi:N-acetylmuramoyl-L-alanine amidase [Candidatus Schmidhempelia bombi]|uniref:N-acetylmuramoyl-L-alanine amidase AmiC n=1 Tax=Candidatus Schmidhempelia bombi str. Bimp TaxID=1387197 RepID=A0AB94IFA2_9GAMM|nr:N-acetylmuramoyl-L-alanine amidase [Candidatus Schmidhempelia bombi]TEA28190.1 N-acetylmuramoyl-L-alanine amidase [Candidatus Schmidhempelia bombi str. Bimp]